MSLLLSMSNVSCHYSLLFQKSAFQISQWKAENCILFVMLRNILRTSRHLVRRQIDKRTLVSSLYCYSLQKTCKTLNFVISTRQLASSSHEIETSDNIDPVVYDKICTETLESLYEYFDELVDQSSNLKGADVTFSVSNIFACLLYILQF